ncbi:MAG: beta-glucosidase [Bacteroidetes bacterium]|nr:MAG: beta-glucosidase [Bacteroidota bacterium]
MPHFPEGFIWGTSTSSFQIEGAWDKGGKGPSIWDAFCRIPGRVHQGDTGEIACDHYHRYPEDIARMAEMGLKHYRFSISWPRIQPDGKGKPNPEGIRFYSELIDRLLAHGITPWVTLYHWDLPLALQMEDDGWLNPDIATYFRRYAEICFEAFGDRVKHWITLNEPWVVAILGYGQGTFAPGRISNREPYVVGHHLLRAHAEAVDCYRTQFQARQGGRIGITNNADWREPLTDSAEDKAAAERALEFFLGWFADPVYRGDYPAVMRERLGERLPTFSEAEKVKLTGSSDFFGLNHYTTSYAAQAQPGDDLYAGIYGNGGLSEDQAVKLSADPTWEKTSMGWTIVPWGCRKLLQWIDARYGRPEIIITENGCAFDDVVEDGAVHDQRRIDFARGYISACHEAIAAGVNLSGYFLWSFMDNFEWASGYSKRFGLHHVDFATGTRTPKDSAHWYARVIRENGW